MAQFYISFPVEDELKDKLYSIIDEVRASPNPVEHAERMAEIILEVSDVGADFFFIKPANDLKLGRTLKAGIRMGLNTSKKAIYGIGRRAIKSMSKEQMLIMADFMESLVLKVEEEEEA